MWVGLQIRYNQGDEKVDSYWQLKNHDDGGGLHDGLQRILGVNGKSGGRG